MERHEQETAIPIRLYLFTQKSCVSPTRRDRMKLVIKKSKKLAYIQVHRNVIVDPIRKIFPPFGTANKARLT
jgi:hypothetical protein